MMSVVPACLNTLGCIFCKWKSWPAFETRFVQGRKPSQTAWEKPAYRTRNAKSFQHLPIVKKAARLSGW